MQSDSADGMRRVKANKKTEKNLKNIFSVITGKKTQENYLLLIEQLCICLLLMVLTFSKHCQGIFFLYSMTFCVQISAFCSLF
jgi:hypothetical protein